MMKRFIIALMFSASALAQCGSSPACGAACYDPSTYTCAVDFNGNLQLCPLGQQVCNQACYMPSQYHCQNGALAQGAAATSAAAAAKPTTSTTAAAVKSTTSAAAAKPATSTTAAAVKTPSTTAAAAKSTTSTTKASTSSTTSTTSSTVRSTSSTTAAATSATVSCQAMFAGLACRTASEDPTKVDASGVANSRNWLCSAYPQYCTDINAGGKFSGCNSVEQLSYAMNLYYAATGPSQGATACNFGGIGILVNPATTAAAATKAAPVVAPTPSPYPQFPAQTADLRIINNCATQLWFEARHGGAGASLPGQNGTSVQALPGSFVDYFIPDTGLSGTRFWAKYGCDNKGQNCLIGDQMQYFPNPPGGCPPGGCTPPVDSLFEATWGCRPGSDCNAQNPTTWFDTSQVDGWTIPYKLTPVGDVSGCDCSGTNCGFKGVDASSLDLAKCPTGEDLTAGGNFSTIVTNGQTVSLKSVDLRIISNGQVLGCMSPCKRLNWGYPFGLQQDESHASALWMCCPTPMTDSTCTAANGCLTPQQCRAGPIEDTQFVAAVHNMAPGVYAYSYDDGVGLHACPAGVTKYTMEFCPAGSAAYPGKA